MKWQINVTEQTSDDHDLEGTLVEGGLVIRI